MKVEIPKIWDYEPGAGGHRCPSTPGGLGGFYYAGNQYALAKNLTPEANAKRMATLLRTWATKARLHAGEKFVPDNQKRLQAKRKRIRLHTTIVKEAREIQDIARTHATAVVQKLAEIVETSGNEAAVIAASQVLLDRAYGKASQTHINANIDTNGKATDVSQKELDARIEKALKRVEDITGRAPKAPESQKPSSDVREHDRDPDGSTFH